MTAYLQSPARTQPHTLLSLGVGAAVMALLVALWRGITGLPLSSLGYLLGSSATVLHHLRRLARPRRPPRYHRPQRLPRPRLR